jgi:hypothetical protein
LTGITGRMLMHNYPCDQLAILHITKYCYVLYC